MGFGIGVTFITGNRAGVRSKVDANGRALGHQGDARALLCELAEERWSATANLDRARSHLNAYGVGGLGRFRSGQEAYEYLCEQVADYDRRAKAAAVAEGRRPPRAVRLDAPVMVSVIAEPEAEYLETLSDADKERLMVDIALSLVECGYIDDPGDVLVSTVHKDEGAWHPTIAFVNRDPATGRIGTSRYNDCRKMDLLHREFLGCLRAKGWDVEGHDVVDRARIKTDPEYAESRKRKRRNQGKSANAYAAQREEKKARERAEAAKRAADAADARLQAAYAAQQRYDELATELKAALDGEIAAKKAEVAELDASYETREQQLRAKEEEIAAPIVERLNDKQRALRKATADVEAKRDELTDLDGQIEAKRAELAEAAGDSDGWDEAVRLADETMLMRAQINRLTRERDELGKRLAIYEPPEGSNSHTADTSRDREINEAPGC